MFDAGGPDGRHGRLMMFTTGRWVAVALTIPIVELALTTAYVHLTLGGLLFTANAVGYALLAGLYALGTAVDGTPLGRFSWMPRLALLGFTLATIAGYLAMGPYFTLGWVTKGVEIALATLVAADIARRYRSIAGLRDAVLGRSAAGTA
jgi:hypothetical protein